VLFPDWETFYVILGSAAGALTGLMFVVVTLIADTDGEESTIEAFGTPTVVHLGAALLLSLILAAPWPALKAARTALGAYGALGIVYTFLVLRRARRQTGYQPVGEDWLFHFVLPLVAYAGVLMAGSALPSAKTPWLFVIGAATVLLLFIGLHNAWDTVTYIVIARWERRRKSMEQSADGTGGEGAGDASRR